MTVAVNGKVAVEAVGQQPFDLILMDCEMPEMNGFEASAAIVGMKAKSLIPDIPIVALTAYAMKGDREKCLAAGMNDYLTKPVRKADLRKMLEMWILGEKGDRKKGDDAPAVITGALDASMLAEAREVLGANFTPFVLNYFEESAKRIARLQAEIKSRGSCEVISREAHTIKSSCAYLGAASVPAAAQALETAAKNGSDIAALEPLLAEFLKAFSAFELALKQEILKNAA